MNQFGSRFEIIEDEPPKPKRKRKSKVWLSFLYLPWRLISIALAAGMTIGIALIFFLTRSPLPAAFVSDNPDMAYIARMPNRPNDVAFSDHDLTAVSTFDLVRVYKGNSLIQALSAYTKKISFSPNSMRLAALSHINEQPDHAMLQIWNMETGYLLNETKVFVAGVPNFVQSNNLAFSPDGSLLAFSAEGGILVMDAETLERRVEIPENALGTSAAALSRDNKRMTAINHYHDFASNQYSTLVQVWDIADPAIPQIIYSLPIADAYAQDAALTADGHYLAYTSRDDKSATLTETIHIQDLVAQKEVLTIPIEPRTHIGPIALSESYIVFQQRSVDNTGDANSLQVASWSANTENADYQPFAKPQPLRSLGVAYMRLWSENGSSGIDYLALDAHMLLRWDFSSNSVRAIPL